MQVLQRDVDVAVARLQKTVGVEREQAPLGNVEVPRLERQSAQSERWACGQVEHGHLAVRRGHHRRRVAGACQGAVPGDRIVDRVDAGGPDHLLDRRPVAVGVRLQLGGQQTDQIVQPRHHLVRFQVEAGEGAHGGAQAAHRGRSVDPVTDHVSHDEGDPGP